MTVNFNTAPYFDDFDVEKNFYKILFKPGYAVQARELNQLQSILQHQVSTVGSHLFKNNSLVIPGGITLNTTADIVSITGLANPTVLLRKTITNAPNFDVSDDSTTDGYITAVVVAVKAATTTEPAALYVQYRKTQTDGRQIFNSSDNITGGLKTVDVNDSIVTFDVDSTLGSTIGKVATLQAGTFFTKNIFVDAANQSIIVEVKNSTVTNCVVGLDIEESIINAAEDESLLDNANGAPNEYAPGADRYKISLTLGRVDINTVLNDDKFIKMLVIENDTIIYVNDNTQYAELMKTLARRTFDANGNFIVKGLETSITQAPDDDYVWANVSRGRCYVGGYEYNQIADRPVAIAKPRSEEYQQEIPHSTIHPDDITFFYVAGDAEKYPEPGIIVQFTNISFETDVPFIETSIIGYGIFRGLDTARRGSAASGTDIYRFFVDNVSFEKGYTINDIGGIRFTGTPEFGYVGGGTSVLHELSISNITGDFEVEDTLVGKGGIVYVESDAVAGGISYTLTGDFSEPEFSFGWRVRGTGIDNTGIGTFVKDITATTVTLTRATTGAVSEVTFSKEQKGYIYYVLPDRIFVRKDTFGSIPYDDTVRVIKTSALVATRMEAGHTYMIVMVGTTDFTDFGSPSNSLGQVFIASGPATGTGIVAVQNAVSATRNATFVSNYSPSIAPLIVINKDTILTVEDVEYSIVRSDTFEISPFSGDSSGYDSYSLSVDGSGDVLDGDDSFANVNARSWFGYIPEDEVYLRIGLSGGIDIELIEIAPDLDQNYLVVLDGDGANEFAYFPSSGTKTLVIYSTVVRGNAVPAGKLATLATIEIPTPSNSWMALQHQDVIGLEKIVDGKVVVVTNATWDDPTNKVTLTATYTLKDGDDSYTHIVGDTVVVRGIESSNNVDGEFYREHDWADGGDSDANHPLGFAGYAGYNGVHILTDVAAAPSVPDGDDIVTVTLTLKYVVPSGFNPGTYVASDGMVALKPNINLDTDITSRFIFDSGNTYQINGTGTIKQVKNTTPVAGQLGVQYTYYAYNDLGVGGYVSVDSYAVNSEGPEDLSYIGEIADVVDDAGNVIRPRTCFDFRNRPSSYFFKNIATIEEDSNILKLKDINVSAWAEDLVEKYVIGPSHGQADATDAPAQIAAVSFNEETGDTELYLVIPGSPVGSTEFPSATTVTGTYVIGLKILDTGQLSAMDTDAGARMLTYPKSGSRMRFAYTKFLPRKTMLYVDRDKDVLTIKSLDVVSVDSINAIRRSETKLPLVYLYFEPYTLSIKDVTPTKFETPVYQMLDIHNLKQRVDNNEYNISLALNRDTNQDILNDASELQVARGFWNEDFMNYQTHDYNSDDFSCTVYDRAYVAPGVTTKTINLELATAFNDDTWRHTGSSVTLPFTESRALGNDKASSFSNLNPYNRIQWEGKMRLYPSVDNWVDIGGDMPPVVDTTPGDGTGVQVPFPDVPTHPPVIIPDTPTKETVTEINVIRHSWGPDSSNGNHAITFEWKTSTGRSGRVNTDKHLSSVVRDLGKSGFNGSYALSLLNKKYKASGVKEYLQAGRHFDQKSPSEW